MRRRNWRSPLVLALSRQSPARPAPCHRLRARAPVPPATRRHCARHGHGDHAETQAVQGRRARRAHGPAAVVPSLLELAPLRSVRRGPRRHPRRPRLTRYGTPPGQGRRDGSRTPRSCCTSASWTTFRSRTSLARWECIPCIWRACSVQPLRNGLGRRMPKTRLRCAPNCSAPHPRLRRASRARGLRRQGAKVNRRLRAHGRDAVRVRLPRHVHGKRPRCGASARSRRCSGTQPRRCAGRGE